MKFIDLFLVDLVFKLFILVNRLKGVNISIYSVGFVFVEMIVLVFVLFNGEFKVFGLLFEISVVGSTYVILFQFFLSFRLLSKFFGYQIFVEVFEQVEFRYEFSGKVFFVDYGVDKYIFEESLSSEEKNIIFDDDEFGIRSSLFFFKYFIYFVKSLEFFMGVSFVEVFVVIEDKSDRVSNDVSGIEIEVSEVGEVNYYEEIMNGILESREKIFYL